MTIPSYRILKVGAQLPMLKASYHERYLWLYALRDGFSSSRGSGYKSSTQRLRLSFRAQGLHDTLHGYLHSQREQFLP